MLTDYFVHTIDNLRHNMELNKPSLACQVGLPLSAHHHGLICRKVEVQAVDWTLPATWPKPSFDVIIGCDLIYDRLLAPSLANIVDSLLAPDGVFLYVCGSQRQGNDEFVQRLQADKSFKCHRSTSKEEYTENPLACSCGLSCSCPSDHAQVGGTQADLDLHFAELAQNAFQLLMLKRK